VVAGWGKIGGVQSWGESRLEEAERVVAKENNGF
jgi:hypothetical protein